MSATPHEDARPRVSPQSRHKCACVAWTSPRECMRVRYNDPTGDEECECPCHYEADQ